MKNQKLIPVSVWRSGVETFISTLATPTDIPGRYWVHKSTDRPGWTVTEEGSGRRLCGGVSMKAAIARGKEIIASVPASRVADVIGSYPAAPDPSTLPYAGPYALPARTRPDLPAMVAAIARVIPLTHGERVAVLKALSPVTGRLRSKRPAGLAGAAWSGMQPNPWKVSVVAFMIGAKEEQDLTLKLSKFAWPAELDKDASNLKAMGAW